MKQRKLIFLAVGVVFVILGAAIVLSERNDAPSAQPAVRAEGVATVEDGVQYIDITARGGYTPRLTRATSGLPTMLRVRTKNTFDCSSALVIPSLNYSSFLKPSDTVLIPIPTEKTTGTLEGLCSMGMYRFSVVFE